MSDIQIKLNVKDLAAQCKEFAKEVEADIKKGVARLAAATHQEVLNMASNGPDKLDSSQRQFLENVKYKPDETIGIYIITILEDGMFVEEGVHAGKMNTESWLLKSNKAKTNKDGKKYVFVPFEWGRPPSSLPASDELRKRDRDYVQDLRKELNAQKIGWKKIERNDKGSPRIGILHEFNFGGPKPGKGNTPIFNRVTIAQEDKTDKNTGKKFIQRNITTFRTATEDKPGWEHPGLKPKHYLEKAEDFFWKEFEEKILPEVFRKWK